MLTAGRRYENRALGAFRKSVSELGGDQAASRVAEENCPVDIDSVEIASKRFGKFRNVERSAWFLAMSMPR